METSFQAIEARAGSAASPLALWHLLSLDAPTVAALWTWFVARAVHVELPPAVLAAMFVAVWLLYAADRLMDTMRDTGELEARHHFHRENRRGFKIAMAVAAVALVPLMAAIPAALLHGYAVLGVGLMLWFGLIHLLPEQAVRRLPKELIPGVFFAAAVFLPCLSLATTGAALCFGLLCVLNCLYIFAWEHTGAADAHASTRLGVRMLTPLTLSCVVGPAALFPFTPKLAPVWIAISCSAALLSGLDWLSGRLDRTHLRAAADLVLLTPLLVAPLLR